MGPFSRKPKVGVEEFCRKFYDSYVFQPIIAGKDLGFAYCEQVVKSVAEVEPSFACVDLATFQKEIAALHVELFGLAWIHQLKGDKYTLPQTVFTKRYLEENGHLETWETMVDYNKTIARSGTEIAPAGERGQRAWFTFLNKLRADLFDKWQKAGVEGHCAARVANRTGTDVAWEKGITVRMLTDTLLQRTGMMTLTAAGRDNLQSVLRGLYAGAKESIRSVDLQVSATH